VNRLLSLERASIRFGDVDALREVSLTLARGERLALVGANGAGKTTLLRALHGLIGCPGRQEHAPTRSAMLFQRPFLLRLSALANVEVGLWLGGVARRQRRERALQALERVGLAPLAARRATALSGGQQQRLALARAWALQPQVLLLDEPTASLDPHAKREVERLMAEFADAGMTLVFASHNLGQVKRLATRVLYLEQGRVLADLPVLDFFNGSVLEQASPEAELFLKGELA